MRSLILFVVLFNLLGWLGWLVAQAATTEAVGLGTLIWLVSPFAVSLGLRLFSRDWHDIGLRPHFRGNGKWYLFSFLVFPVIVTAVVVVGTLTGATSLSNFQPGALIAAAATALAFTVVKNILEEFAWRGYMTPKVNALVKDPLMGHLLVGLTWGVWHIPYYLALLDRDQLAAYTPLSLSTYLPLVIIGMTVAGILFGELRLVTRSTWPAVVMHTTSNVLITTLLIDGHVHLSSGTAFLLTPSWEGVLSMVLIAGAGLWLYQRQPSRR
jgi:membrane protease YdiL (CAAX protease family)